MKSIFILIGLLLNIVILKAGNKAIELDFGLLKKHQIDTQTFTISNDYKYTIQYKGTDLNSDYTIISQPSIKGKSQSVWTIVFHPKKNGLVNDSIRLYFQSGSKKLNYTLHIKANVIDLLQNRMLTFGQDYTILIDSSIIDLDTITEGEQVSYKIRFRNIGNQAVSIISHSTSCGCDWISYPRESVLPGAYGYFSYHYNSSSRVGEFIKTTNVMFPNQQINIRFKGFVKVR
jgi:hypothetical protein